MTLVDIRNTALFCVFHETIILSRISHPYNNGPIEYGISMFFRLHARNEYGTMGYFITCAQPYVAAVGMWWSSKWWNHPFQYGHIHPTINKHYTIRQQPNRAHFAKSTNMVPIVFTKLVCNTTLEDFELIILFLKFNMCGNKDSLSLLFDFTEQKKL